MKISVIIPSLNPDDKLVSVVDSLVKKGFEDIIIVNDGSDSAHLWPFEKVGSYSQCTIPVSYTHLTLPTNSRV